jgi:DNA-binding response OmpR family regulator
MDGLEVCRTLRRNSATQGAGIIMLTAKGEESDIVVGLEMGADDYVTKPFSPRELLARIRAVLRTRSRRTNGEPSSRIELGDVVLDALRHEVLVGGKPIGLTRAEFRLLWTLASHPGRVYTRDQLVESITAGESIILDRNVDVHVSAVRKKLGSEADVIATVRGVGYRCKD